MGRPITRAAPTQTPTNPANNAEATPNTGNIAGWNPDNPFAGTPIGAVFQPTYTPPETSDTAQAQPVAQDVVPSSGANVTPNEETWSQPNAETAAYTGDAGFGRTDTPIGSAASGFVRTNVSPGAVAGGVPTVPTPMRLPGDTITVQRGDTLKTLAQRGLGDESFWPRLHVVQNDYLISGPSSAGDIVLKAGTVLPLGGGNGG